MPWYLLSHISNNRGVVKFEVIPSDTGFVLGLVYIPEMTGRDEIIRQLNEPELKVHLSDGSTQTYRNPYKF
jgi:hypothetical protein